MRKINYIVMHCTATPQKTTIASMLNYWKDVLKWKSPGYHYIINPDGTYKNLQPIEKPSNGVAGYNQNSIHISYIGGVDAKNNPLDNRTPQQITTQIMLIKGLKKIFPGARVLGHRDFAGVSKACPSFDVEKWWGRINY